MPPGSVSRLAAERVDAGEEPLQQPVRLLRPLDLGHVAAALEHHLLGRAAASAGRARRKPSGISGSWRTHTNSAGGRSVRQPRVEAAAAERRLQVDVPRGGQEGQPGAGVAIDALELVDHDVGRRWGRRGRGRGTCDQNCCSIRCRRERVGQHAELGAQQAHDPVQAAADERHGGAQQRRGRRRGPGAPGRPRSPPGRPSSCRRCARARSPARPSPRSPRVGERRAVGGAARACSSRRSRAGRWRGRGSAG